MTIVRRMRIIEYVGPEDWVIKTTENPDRYVNGLAEVSDTRFIREYLAAVEVVEGADV